MEIVSTSLCTPHAQSIGPTVGLAFTACFAETSRKGRNTGVQVLE
jgi:hypothetical protein